MYALQDVDLFTAGVSEIPLPGRLLGNQSAVNSLRCIFVDKNPDTRVC
jgi:hypothetical protein